MKWEFGRRSENVEDQRDSGGGLPMVSGGIGALILAFLVMMMGGDPTRVLQQVSRTIPGAQSGSVARSPASDQLADFVSVVLADTEDTWRQLFQKMGRTYVDPKLVLFTGSVQSACGFAQAAMGPFYCPADKKVYIDLSFYQDLKQKHNAPGDFAQAYVIAHEVGHHVQNLLGISGKVHQMQRQVDKAQANALSVRLELQADCFAGVWGYHADKSRQLLESGDLEEALAAASSIGDDRLQQRARGYVVPESFTHGTSAQRVQWFKRGFTTGNIAQCNTFKGRV